MSYNRSNAGAAALVFARSVLMGKPYVFGGDFPPLGTSVGTDCSGAAQLAYNHVGVNLPRTTYAQYLVCSIALTTVRLLGDLLFYRGSDPGPNGEPGHVGLYAGLGVIGPTQHTFSPHPKGAEVVFNAPFTGDPGGIRYDYSSDMGDVVAVTRPALILAPAPKPTPSTEDEMVVLTKDPNNNGEIVLDLSTGKYYGLSNPAVLAYYEACGVKIVAAPTKAVFAKFTQSGTI